MFQAIRIVSSVLVMIMSSELTAIDLRHAVEWGVPRLVNGFNLHKLDSESNGFAIYRMSAPNKKDMKKICDLNISEVIVLSGNSTKHEKRYAQVCPHIKVVEFMQSPKTPISAQFLDEFDAIVAAAMINGKKIAFRCTAGAHRTGRLAAYYELKYKNMELEAALKNLEQYGFMNKWFQSQLVPQVHEINRFILGQPCVFTKHCVQGRLMKS